MQISGTLTDDAILAELGDRLARVRLQRNLTQREVADEAGVARSTVDRMERGRPATLANLVRVMRALGIADQLDLLVPEPVPSPLELAKLHGRQRRRASGSRTSVPRPEPGAGFVWGDEQEGQR